MDPQKAERFVWDNGGKVATFFDRTTQTIALHLNPYSVQLLSAQLVPHPLAQSQDFSRDDVARLTNRSANEFDEWVRKTREMGGKLDISWCRTKDGTKVLPHFKAKEIRLYLELNGVRLFDGLA
ncbi:MAG TPA: hypothetical protein VLF60_03420 [Candidatus Saccharimonadales bacterium]|nr:hypothetical protein [Candidatus Saccharimonadales bacterium]